MPIDAKAGGINGQSPHGVRDGGYPGPSEGPEKPYDQHQLTTNPAPGGRSNDAHKPK